MKIEYIKCKICNQEQGKNGFCRHLSDKHGLMTKQYYDKYLKKPKEGKCIVCGKPTTFVSITKGYKTYCCIQCCNKSETHKNKCISTNLKRYGVENVGTLRKKPKVEKPPKPIKKKTFKKRQYSSKQLVATEYRYLCNDKYDIFKNVGKGIIKYFDNEYEVTKNIPKLREKYKGLYKSKKQVFIKNSAPEKLIALCSLGKVYVTNDLTELEFQIIKKLKLDNQVISRTDVYGDRSAVKCALCGKISDKIASHLFNSHPELNHKKYYDKYLKKPKEGICPVCGKECKFLDMVLGYTKCCCPECSHILSMQGARKTCLEKYGVKFASQSKEIKKKIEKTNLKRYGVKCALQSDKVKKKIEKTNLKRYGVKFALQSDKVQKKIAKTNLQKYGVKCVFQSPEIKERIKATNRRNCGFDFWHQSPDFQEVVKKSNLENYGVEYPSQLPENRKRMSERINNKKDFRNRRKENKGYLSSSEKLFSKYLNTLKFNFKSEYKLEGHNFDFAIFKDNKLDCLIEIDGEYWHGMVTDLGNSNDYTRYSKVPDRVKFVVIDSLKIDIGIREVIRVYNMKYKDWKKEMQESIPKTIKYPKFTDAFLKRNWNYLTDKTKNRKINYEWINSNIGKSIIIQFCPEYAYRKLDYKKIRNNLFMSPFSSKNYLEGYESLKNIPKLMIKYRNHKSKVIVKKHSPEKMLAICALGKTYLSKEHFDKGSKDIIKYFNLKAYEV